MGYRRGYSSWVCLGVVLLSVEAEGLACACQTGNRG